MHASCEQVLGGRFVPDSILEQYGIKIPTYSGRELYMDITAMLQELKEEGKDN